MSWFGKIQLSVKLKRIWKRRRFIRKRRKYYLKLRSRKTYIKEQSFLREIQKICSQIDLLEEGRLSLSSSCHDILGFHQSSSETKIFQPEAETTRKASNRSPASVSLLGRVRRSRWLRNRTRRSKKNLAVGGEEVFYHGKNKLLSHLAQSKSRSDSSKEAKLTFDRDLLHLQSGDQRYFKYIPVPDDFGIFYPKGTIDKYFPSCWLEIQSWYVRYLSEKFPSTDSPKSVCSSRSDVSVGSGRGSRDSMSNTVSTDLFDDGHLTTTENEVTTERSSALTTHPRFGMFSNLEYLEYARQLTHYQGRVRVQFLVGASCHPHQCHLKTNMILTCLRSFFHNGGDLEVMWTRNLIRQLPIQSLKLVFDAKIASILAMQLAEARAILFVTHEAAILLRHPSTAFLDTLARAAGITREQLVVLPWALGPGQGSERLELRLARLEDEDSEEEAEVASSLLP